MTYEEFITLYTKKLIKKKDRDLIFNTIQNKEFVDNFYSSQEYKISREKNLPLFSYILKHSFNDAQILFSKEKVSLFQIIPGIVFNKEISSVKKLSQFYALSEDDLKIIFSPINKNKPESLFIERICQDNLPFAVDLFDKFRSSFTDEQYFLIDKYIKLAMINAITLNEKTTLKNETSSILKKFPFFELNEKSYKDGTYELLRLSIEYNSTLYNYETFINESYKVKLDNNHIIELFDYLFFKKEKHYGYRNNDIGNAQFYTFLTQHIKQDTFIPDFLNILNNLSKDHRSFRYEYYLPPMLKCFDHKSFLSVDTGKLDNDANALHHMLENGILSDTSISTRIHYINSVLNKTRKSGIFDFRPPYNPKNVLTVLKTLSTEDIHNNVDINYIFSLNHTFYYQKTNGSSRYYDNEKEQHRILLNDSHKVIDFLIKNNLYPNTQENFITRESFLVINTLEIQDKIVYNKLMKLENNDLYFLNFIEAVLNDKDLSFYIQRKNFIDDFYENKNNPLISSFLKKGLTKKSEEIFDYKTKPFFEQYQIKKALKENDYQDIPNPIIKRRI